jgi:RHS repeat-associated protein
LEERDNAGQLSAKHVHGVAVDELLATVTPGGTRYLHEDGLGNVVALTGLTGAVLERVRYDAYGQPEHLTAAGSVSGVSPTGNRFLFTGREWFPELGLQDNRHRYYHPGVGRWLSRDPIGERGGLNLYGYVENDPINAFDGDGLSTVRINGQTVLVDPTNQQFRETIKSYPDGSIRNLEITGHGSRYAQEIGKGATPQGLIWYPGVSRAIQIDDDASFLKDLLAPKMIKGGNIDLRGFNTAREWYLFGDGQNITRQLSVERPNVSVTGSRGFYLGNEWNAPWDHDIGFRIGRENHALVRTWRTYLNGK